MYNESKDYPIVMCFGVHIHGPTRSCSARVDIQGIN